MIQAGWNFERMQNIGFAFALCPAMKKIWTTPQTLKQALKRHMASFNTQPYMASFMLGLVWRLEERMAASARGGPAACARGASASGGGWKQSSQGKESSEEHQMRAAKKTASSALAAIGDTLFWGTLRPATLGICLLVWCFFGFYSWIVPIAGQGGIEGTHLLRSNVPMISVPSLGIIFAGLLAGLIVYNGFALWVRWRGLAFGYECGQKNSISCGLDAVNWQKIIRILKIFCFAAAVVIIGILLMKGQTSFGGMSQWFPEIIGTLSLQGSVPSLAIPLMIFVFTWIMKKLKFTNVSACGVMFLGLTALLYLLDNFVV